MLAAGMHDVIIAGLGAMGSAAAHHLARRGLRVLGLDAFARGHDRGSSTGLSRVIRLAYFEHTDYVPLLRRAWELWRELERDSGERSLLRETGALHIGREDGPMLSGALASVRAHQLDHERLDAADICDRYPGLQIQPPLAGLLEQTAGFLAPERCIDAHLRLAGRAGAELRFGEPVLSWQQIGESVAVTTPRATYPAARLVLTAGAWMSRLLGDLFALRVERIPTFWFEPGGDPAALGLDRLPVWLIEDADDGEMIYGFPYLAEQGLKAARHHSGVVCDPDTVDRSPRAADEDSVRAGLRRYLPAAADAPLRATRVCLYTTTADGQFAIGRYPEAPSVAFASACSGHGFKFAPVIGEILADLATEGATHHPIQFVDPVRLASVVHSAP